MISLKNQNNLNFDDVIDVAIKHVGECQEIARNLFTLNYIGLELECT